MYNDPLHVAFIRTNQWLQAIELQTNRVIGPTLDPRIVGESNYRNHWNQKQRDIDYFILALNRFQRGIRTVNKLINCKEIECALEIFDKSVPDLKNLRDIGEHFDEYDWGKGKIEKELTNESPTYSWGSEDGGITYRGKTLTVIKSRNAARVLHKTVMDTLGKRGKNIALNEWPLVQDQKK